MSAIQKLNERLERLEGASSSKKPNIVDLVNRKIEEEKNQEFEAIYQEILQKGKKYGGSWAKLAVYLVEMVEECAPKIAKILGHAFVGELKMELVISLIIDILGELPLAVDLFKDVVNQTVYLLFNKDRDTITVGAVLQSEQGVPIPESEPEQPLKKKKSRKLTACFTPRSEST